MFPYILNILITMILGMCAISNKQSNNLKKIPNCLDEKYFNYNIFGAILLNWILLYSLRGTTGTDAGGYWHFYKIIYTTNTSFWWTYNAMRDKLFQVMIWGMTNLFHGMWIPACAVMGFILYAPVLYIIKEKSIDPLFSCLMYIFTMSIYFGFNGVRQGLSMGLASMAFYCFLKEKKYYGYILLMLIAYGFHSATMIIVPFHIIMLQKINSIRSVLIVLGFILCYIYLMELWGSMIGILSDLGQNKFASNFRVISKRNMNRGSYLRILVSASILTFGIIKYKTLSKLFPDYDIDMWVIILGVCSAVFTRKFVYFARVGTYISYGMMLTVPKLTYAFGKNNARNVKYIIGILYFFYMIAFLLHGDSDLYPYIPVWISERY